MNHRIALSKILQSVKFFDQLVVELNLIFNHWYSVDDAEATCLVKNTQGWQQALLNTLDYFSLHNIAEWYKKSDWVESDNFDDIIAELLMSKCFDYEGNLINNNYSVKNYSKIWNNFQFRSPTYIDGHIDPYKFDLVKWYEHEPLEAYNYNTKKTEISTKGCYSVGMLEWDRNEECFEFRSCGMRYFDAHTPGLETFIKDFADTMQTKLAQPIRIG